MFLELFLNSCCGVAGHVVLLGEDTAVGKFLCYGGRGLLSQQRRLDQRYGSM